MSRASIHQIITKTGDSGKTNLVDRDVHKSDPIIECIGSIDEANASIGYARYLLGEHMTEFAEILDQVQNNLFDLAADLICNTNKINEDYVKSIEEYATHVNSRLAPLQSFVIPKGISAPLHLSRAIVRRAERAFWQWGGCANPCPGIYLNRLSDLLFILCRAVHNSQSNAEEVWKRVE